MIFPRLIRRLVLAMMAFMITVSATMTDALCLSLFTRPKSQNSPRLPAPSLSDVHSEVASSEAVEVANHLHLIPKFRELESLRKQAQAYKGEKLPLELREDLRDVKEEIMEAIEQARLEVDFVQSELAVEIAGQSELLQAYSEARDNHINEVNLWSFRTNGALWAVAEALDIPTYKYPRYSIPSGAIGIVAGVVPSVFSALAVRQSGGGHFDREPRPNMLAKIFDYPVVPTIDYPDSLLAYMRAVPANEPNGQSRIDRLISRWTEDTNIHVFTDRNSRKQLDVLTGAAQHHLTIQLVADRLTMLQQLSALVTFINRPLLELIMVVRGAKHFPVNI
jgi:hypothetical protein